MQRLSFLVGDWTHVEIYHGGPQAHSGPGAGRSKATWLLGNHFVYILYATRGPWGYLEGRGFLGWDEAEKSYRLDWFDDRGHRRHLVGGSAREGEIALAGDIPWGAQKAEERVVLRHRDDGKILLTIEVVLADHKAEPFLEAVLSPLPTAE
jgi:hypothetical protein